MGRRAPISRNRRPTNKAVPTLRIPSLATALALGVGVSSVATAVPVTLALQAIDKKAEAHKKAIDSDIRAGTEYAVEVEKKLKFTKDAKAQERLERVGNVIAEIARSIPVAVTYGDKRLSPFPYKFKLVEGKDVNAFSIPGGNIYVNEGLVQFVESDDELAAVLAHEVSHAAFRHYATMQKDSAVINALSLPILVATILAKNDATYGAMVAANMAGQAFVSGWSVEAETAADYGAVQYLVKSPYQPVAVLSFMERLARRDVLTTRSDWTIYTTHPPSELRAHHVLAEIRKAGAPLRRSLVSTSLRARSEKRPDVTTELWFGKEKITVFRGEEADSRASEAVARLNDFLDEVPEMYQVTSAADGSFLGKGKLLFQVQPGDSFDHAASVQAAATALRKAVFAAALNASFSGRSGA